MATTIPSFLRGIRPGLFALFGLAEHEPITVLASAVVCNLPLGVNDRPFAYLDDAVTGFEAYLPGSVYQIMMRPLITVMVDIVCDLGEKDSFMP